MSMPAVVIQKIEELVGHIEDIHIPFSDRVDQLGQMAVGLVWISYATTEQVIGGLVTRIYPGAAPEVGIPNPPNHDV